MEEIKRHVNVMVTLHCEVDRTELQVRLKEHLKLFCNPQKGWSLITVESVMRFSV